MSRVAAAIAKAKSSKKGAVIGYLPLGFSSLSESIAAVKVLIDSGFDLIEMGLPYSDPAIDGPVIQLATTEALAKGFQVKDLFKATRELSEYSEVPLLVMSYWNLIYRYGVTNFAQDFKTAGGAGVITPDLIPDEAADWISATGESDLDRIFLAAPSSTDERLAKIQAASTGFVYTVSTMGITGERSEVSASAKELVRKLRNSGDNYSCVGIGISNQDQVAEVLEYADGAIIGTALVRALASGGLSQLEKTAKSLVAGSL